MKKNKLRLEKFSIVKLNNPSKIVGGDGGTNGVTNTEDEENDKKCVTSLVLVDKDKDE